MMRKPSLWMWLPATAVITLLTLPAHATTITSDLTKLAPPDRWQAAYTVANDTLAVDIEELAIYFQVGQYDNLLAGSQPGSWDAFVLQPDIVVPADGLYEPFTFVAGIAPGTSLGGFVVSFDFFGTGSPGAQFFEILDPFTFEPLDTGFTRSAQQPVPEPGTMALLGSLLMGFALMRRRRVARAIAR